ncbi:Tungstate ABC transporter, substrate-binding protein [Candidatus Syntrophocurvum alkaliphilum]|uniref:Tungstate ABC transporter, substrate-binding protein n=1 Tax=Candidatus Syntrophocurvum alkaliphilum TaxID=2293317 RepID=A0A6I6DDA5_9FIRM|nr:substrate-binding domain-containing protein [Candidatus Syntrophocurvum alkaliphilum]QGT98608.1 Tungstate ABC transporter, substrate-binding protein [Candidatus Syntrophocurvum alkaliphilum]
MMIKKSFVILVIFIFMFVSFGCGQADRDRLIKLATTTSTEDSGLLNVLLPEFTADTGYSIDVIAVGTGQAINMGEKGDVDVILVHARDAEDEFVDEGYGVNRKDVMYNDFLIIGPEEDPAEIKGENDVIVAMEQIAETESTFVSRGDQSGTHMKELSIWEASGIKPQGEWYKEVGQGMGDTYRVGNVMDGYVFIDRATFLFNRDNYELVEMVEGDELLVNHYGIIAVNPELYSHVNYEGVMTLIEWITSEKGQDIIEVYGVDQFGQPLFVPNAK